ncbi:hypothetical protein ACFVH6_06590 [Spirillospora sp. NPDC127200]
MSSRLGVEPDRAWDRGSRRRPGTPPRDHTLWARDAEVPGSPPRPEDPEMTAWLATARASLDIDQYIYHDCPGMAEE